VRVGIHAPLNDLAVTTGPGQYVQSLTAALADLRRADTDLPEIDYVLFVSRDRTDWIDPVVREEMDVRELRSGAVHRGDASQFADLDVVQFLLFQYADAACPTLYNPYDLRHLLHPDFFDSRTLERRSRLIDAGCEAATAVDTPSRAVAENVVAEYDRDPDRVQPTPLGPTLTADGPVTGDPGDLRAQYDLPDSFVLYPAITWSNKNHRRLVEALASVAEEHGEQIPLVCCGARDDRGAAEQFRIESLEALGSTPVRDLGFVDADHLRALYRECRALVYPSLFEGGGLPVIEGWQFDAPVVCSDIPPLREKGGDAAAYFDPTDVSAIGETIHEVWTDDTLRAELVERGRARRERFTWRRTARIYHALYRKTAGRDLSAADEEVLRYPE
jgi:glycosyltransferase involved in cell wall biosynthesis